MKRCGWVKLTNPLYVDYHDKEWGKSLHDDTALFECLCLESYQSGLSWETVLNKRQAFRQVFHDYDIVKVSEMSDKDLNVILENPAVIRHRQKIYATRTNAKAVLSIQKSYGSFDRYIWSFVEGKTKVHQVQSYQELPRRTSLSETISKDLKKRGFSFVGPVTVYSFLQAAGLMNVHEETCDFRN